jgi:tetratricopeptide (TPR) repeat protein
MAAETPFAELQDQLQAGGATAVFDKLAGLLREQKDYHKLFDALCARKKFELGAPLHRPTSFDDIPASKRDEFEVAYMSAAREVGQLLLADKKLGQAWIYFHAIRETQPVRDVIDAAPVPRETSEESEELIDLAFYKLAHPVKGMQIMLRTHGTCSTITSLDQQFQNLSPEQRSQCAAILVKSLHGDLLQSIQHEVKQRMPFAPPATPLRELIAGREWLFADNNYHIDVSHLHSTVRFARSLVAGSPELKLALDLTEYASQLSPQFQYAGEAPFTDFYPAHSQFFKFLLDENRDTALAYFQQQLDREPDAQDKALIAYVLVDLLARTEQLDKALPLAEQYLVSVDPDFAAAFAELCQQAGRFDVLLKSAQDRSDLVTFASALVQK